MATGTRVLLLLLPLVTPSQAGPGPAAEGLEPPHRPCLGSAARSPLSAQLPSRSGQRSRRDGALRGESFPSGRQQRSAAPRRRTRSVPAEGPRLLGALCGEPRRAFPARDPPPGGAQSRDKMAPRFKRCALRAGGGGGGGAVSRRGSLRLRPELQDGGQCGTKASDNSQRFRETCFAFALTPQQVQQISSSMDISGTKCDFTVQVQLRFCLSETSCPQEDHFPPNLCVKVNGKPCSLPGYLPPTKNGVEPKRPSRPINITSLVRLSTTVPNTIVVSWTAEIGRNYSMAVYLVKQLSSTVLLQRLRAKGIRNPDHSRALIKEKLTADPDSEIATTSLRVSLLCPLGKMRLTIPCRALTCSHLQCFDATLYIQMNEKKPTWVCPVCDKKAPYEHLIIDGLFMEILKYCTDCDEIQFKEDGSWAPMRSKKEVQEVTASYNGVDGCISSSLEHQVSSHQQSNKNKKVEVIDLTIDSSSDEEDEEPSAKRSCPSVSPASPLNNKGILNLPHQASPVSRTPSLPAVDTSYINTSLIQDYRHPFHMTPMPYDLQGLDFFPFLSGDNQPARESWSSSCK
ncbi:E3 SUMO-protein ligase PIAS1 isoform X3 [Neopsephotus bourkii]|uniref:E3 SUMO-protein ligase PIAS1 isoform X3 n=1 Tax=Neopsephotus bourkii TaxID=309878 RepID=UPI002AA51287|nr:E3 SUMO-protein ligase PIAS1 isoform X3 [Neopsephotus bourkii]